MQRLGVSGAVRPIYGSLGVKRLIKVFFFIGHKITLINFDNNLRSFSCLLFFTCLIKYE